MIVYYVTLQAFQRGTRWLYVSQSACLKSKRKEELELYLGSDEAIEATGGDNQQYLRKACIDDKECKCSITSECVRDGHIL